MLAVIFDMDELMLDTQILAHKALKTAAVELDFSLDNQRKRFK